MTQTVQMPNGDTLEFPDDTNPSVMEAFVKSHAARNPVPSQSASALIGIGAGFDKAAAGLRSAVPESVRNALDWANSKMGMADPPSIDPATQKANAAAMKPLENAYPMTMALSEDAPALAAKTPLVMAAMAALNYGTPEERATAAAGGYVGGKAGQLVGTGISRALQPVRGAGEEAINYTKQLFDKYGLNGLPGQTTGSAPLRWMESTLANLPGGGRIRDVVASQQAGLNKATMAAAGGTGDAVTPEAVQAAKNAFGATFNDAAKPVTVAITPSIANSLTSVENEYYKNLSPDQRSIVKQYIDDILSHGENGMPGDVYQKARSRIAARAASTTDSELKGALTGIRQTLDGAFDASAGPEAAAAMLAARGQYRVAKTIEPLANVTGDVSAARLATAAKGLPGAGGDLAQLGSRMKGLPDSGTAQRLFYQSLLSGGVGGGAGLLSGDPNEGMKWGAGSFAGPWLASQLLTRAPVKNYLTRGLMNVSPEVDAALKRIGQSSGGLLGLLATQ